MHAYTLAIILFLLLSSLFLELLNPISVEATNKRLPSFNDGGVFKASLIHRDYSPLSPYYNPSLTLKERLKRSPLGSTSRSHSIRLSSSYYDSSTKNDDANNNNLELLDLTPKDGAYYMKFTLGTPKVEQLALVDTGSDLIWVQCSPCLHCLQQKFPLFEPTKSSTYQTIPCTSSTCTQPDIRSGCRFNSNNHNVNKSSPCTYVSKYGDGSRGIGTLANETITLPSSDNTTASMSLPSLIFGCGYNQTRSPDSENGEGNIGLGTGPSSLISQLGPRINYKFSYCLTPLSSNVDSKLAFGADVTDGAGVVSSTPFTTGGGSHFYNLFLDGISISRDKNNTPVQVPMGFRLIIDSGSTFTYLPGSVYSSLRDALASAIELSIVPSGLQDFLDLCYNNSGARFNPPDVVFHFRGADVVLKAINTFIDIGDGIICLAMMATNKTTIFGNIAQVNFQIGYDLTAKQVSFVPTDCTKF